MKKPRILLTYIESGMGHIMSMSAIAEGLKQKYADKFELIESYIMDDSGNKNTQAFEKFLCGCTKETNKHKGFGMGVFIFLEIMGKQHFMRFIHRTVFKKYTDATIEAMRSYNPDVIISTHYFITFAAIELKKRYMPNLTVITYNPDNNVHVWWDNRSDLMINNNDEACNEAIRKRNFDYSKVRKVFFTARQEVANANGTKEEYRLKYNIPQDKFTVMIADGAYASGKAQKVCKLLLKSNLPITIIFLAGKNKTAYNYFVNKAKNLKNKDITLIPLEFTKEAYEYYGASDIFITKAGPNAVLDSLFMGTPVLIDYYAHPIEKSTAHLFTHELECGIEVYKLKKIPGKIKEMMENPSILKEYKKNIKKNVNKKNNGSLQIADIIYNEIISKR